MSHQFMLVTDESGNILDPHLKPNLELAMGPAFQVQDVFIYSHGWWTSSQRAAEIYNRFVIEFTSAAIALSPALPLPPAFGLGLHWPSMLSENMKDISNYFEALSVYGMANRANAIGASAGFSLLRMLLSRPAGAAPLRIHLIGHSFGCKVVCMALQRLVDKGVVPATGLGGTTIDAVLIQGAFNNDELEDARTADYSDVVRGIPGLRMLVTKSSEDAALRNQFKRAQRFANLFGRVRPAVGDEGPTQAAADGFGGKTELAPGRGFDYAAAPPLAKERLVVADLSALHKANAGYQEDAHLSAADFAFGGHHSDIFLPELYDLMLSFFFKSS